MRHEVISLVDASCVFPCLVQCIVRNPDVLVNSHRDCVQVAQHFQLFYDLDIDSILLLVVGQELWDVVDAGMAFVRQVVLSFCLRSPQ